MASTTHSSPSETVAETYTVITFGTYDLFHVGHQRVIERARDVAEREAAKRGLKARLVVGVSSDALNRKKKVQNTIVPGNERLVIVAALKVVDNVFFEESLELKCEYVKQFAANCLVMGDDHAGRFGEVEEHGCARVFLPRTAGISTTERVLGIIANDKLTEEATLQRKKHEAALYASLILELAQSNMTTGTILSSHEQDNGDPGDSAPEPVKIDLSSSLRDDDSDSDDELPLQPKLGGDGTFTVITFGTYDLFHVGHLQVLDRARKVAEQQAAERGLQARLVVGVSSNSLHRKKKAVSTIVPCKERVGIIAGFKVVDDVFVEKSLDLKCEYVKQFGANCLVMGYNHEGRFAEVEEHGCSREFLPRTAGISTMERVRGIISNGKMTEEANLQRKKHEKEQYAALAQHEAERLAKKGE